jgi:histone deacetylase 1/2
MMNALGHLSIQEPYNGTDRVCIADGADMRISHIGQASLLSPTSRQLHLHSVLCVPLVTRNFVSIKKITTNNDVFVEFHPSDVFVKDRATRDVLLRGRCHQDLYAIDAPLAPQVFICVRASSTHWHSRLGHLASPVVSHVLHRHELPTIHNSKSLAVCDACQQRKSHQLPFVLSSRVVKYPLEIVYSDVWGPAQTSVSGHNYWSMSVSLMPIVALPGFI